MLFLSKCNEATWDILYSILKFTSELKEIVCYFFPSQFLSLYCLSLFLYRLFFSKCNEAKWKGILGYSILYFKLTSEAERNCLLFFPFSVVVIVLSVPVSIHVVSLQMQWGQLKGIWVYYIKHFEFTSKAERNCLLFFSLLSFGHCIVCPYFYTCCFSQNAMRPLKDIWGYFL